PERLRGQAARGERELPELRQARVDPRARAGREHERSRREVPQPARTAGRGHPGRQRPVRPLLRSRPWPALCSRHGPAAFRRDRGAAVRGMSAAITRWTPAEELARVDRLIGSSEAERRRFAAKAVSERDHEALWLVTRAYLEAQQRAANTVASYRKGVMLLLEAW